MNGTTFRERIMDVDTIMFAWATGRETVTRLDDESVEEFAFRAHVQSGWAQCVRMANLRGAIVAVSYGGAAPIMR